MTMDNFIQHSESKSIFIVDDDIDYLNNITRYMIARGYHVVSFASAEEYLKAETSSAHAFHVVDLALPGLDGVDLIALVRSRGSRGIIVVSGRVGPDAYNSALAAGADLYLQKPIRFDQVIFSIQALQRRYDSFVAPAAASGWMIRAASSMLRPPGAHSKLIHLAPAELGFLLCLAHAEGATLSREALVRELEIEPGPDFRNLTALAYRLRRKLEAETTTKVPFRAVHGVGYAAADPIAVHAGE